jgi:predicted PurR-regulated permease PerM
MQHTEMLHCNGAQQVFKTTFPTVNDMEKSMSRNPNMLRTLIGLGLVLIIILGYAVHSNTVDSEYYLYETTNSENNLEIIQLEENMSEWYVVTDSAITWINTTIEGAPQGSILRLDASGVDWYHTPSLGQDDKDYNCKEFAPDYVDLIETCIRGPFHEINLDEQNKMVGLVSLDLPIGGLGSVQADNLNEANETVNEIIEDSTRLITWKISILDSEGNIISSQGIDTNSTATTHELISVYEFELDPIQESLYSLATLVGCFTLLLILPMIAYFSALYKEKKDEEARQSTPELEIAE